MGVLVMKRLLFVGGILIVLILLFFFLIPMQTYLVIESRDKDSTEPVLFYISEGDTFSVRYTHSIHLSEVEEFYRQTPPLHIQQTMLLYEDTSIGMPANAEGNENFEVTEEGKYLISNMNRKFPFIDIQIGQVIANHRFVYKNKEYPLANYFEKGSIVRMEFKKLSLFNQWKGVTVVGKR